MKNEITLRWFGKGKTKKINVITDKNIVNKRCKIKKNIFIIIQK